MALLFLLPVPGHADERGEPPPPGCAPQFGYELQAWRHYFEIAPPGASADELAGESRRIGASPDILRHLDRLYLALEDEKLVVLTDCAIGGNGAYRYLYDHHDHQGDFYVVTKIDYEDFYFLLVSRKTGLTFRAFSVPGWSADKKRFFHWRCSDANGPNELYIVRPTQEGLRTEATIPLPCDGKCQVSWQAASAISVACSGSSAVAASFRVVLRGDTWTRVPN